MGSSDMHSPDSAYTTQAGLPTDSFTSAEDKPSVLPLFNNAASWVGPDMAKQSDWRVQLSAEEVRELDTAVDAALARGLDMAKLTQADFPLPLLGPTLQKWRREILHGRGFFLLRGWPGQERSVAQTSTPRARAASSLGLDFRRSMPSPTR